MLWDGERCRLVDFEDGGLSDPAYELADHVEHIASRLTGVYDAPALVGAVGLDEAARRRFTAYRPLWAAFWLAMLLPGNGGWRRNPAGHHGAAGPPPAGPARRLTGQGASRAFAQFASSLVAVSGLSITPWVVHWATAWT